MKRTLLAVGVAVICSFASNLSADTPQIRLSIKVESDNIDEVQMLSAAVSREFRKLEAISVTVTDTQPELEILCIINRNDILQSPGGRRVLEGYVASVVIVAPNNNRLIAHAVHTGSTVDVVAHNIATALNGSVIEEMRRAAQPSSTP